MPDSDASPQRNVESRRIRLPSHRTVQVVALLLIVAACAVWYGVRWHRVRSLMQFVEDGGGHAESRVVGPEWLHETVVNCLGDEAARGLEEVTLIGFALEPVSQDKLERLSTVTELRELSLHSTDLDDDGLRHVRGLINLRTLDIAGTDVSGTGLKHLRGLRNLERLDLSVSDVSGDGLQHVGELTQLTFLSLERTPVTDLDLQHLSGLTGLKRLGLHNTRVTDEGVEELRRQLPDCEIFH